MYCSAIVTSPHSTADRPGVNDRRRFELTVISIGVFVLLWKMHAFKLPSQIADEQLTRVNALRAGRNQPALIGPQHHLLQSLADWLRPWRWGRGDLLKSSTPTGGDFGAHVWLPDFIKRSLLPKGRLTGWSNDFFGGFPAAAFYFPLPHVFIALLSFLLPYGMAFKLVSVAGICSLPFATYHLGRSAALAAPGPLFMGLAAFIFLLGRNYDLYIYGGSILPTMAGEFSFSISLSLGVFFLAKFVTLLRTGRGKRSTSLVLACTGLSHLLPTLFVVVSALAILGVHTIWERRARAEIGRALRNSMFVFAVAGLLVSWWMVPFAANLAYTNDMGWEKSTRYIEFLFPFLAAKPPPDSQLIAIAFALGAFGLLHAIRSLGRTVRSNRAWLATPATAGDLIGVDSASASGAPAQKVRTHDSFGERFIVAMGLVVVFAGLLFRFSPQHRLWNARILPFWFLSVALLGAYGGALIPKFGVRSKSFIGILSVLIGCGLPLRLLPGWLPVPRESSGLVGFQRAGRTTDTNAMMGWTGHNFAGYEAQPGWPEYRSLMTEAARVGAQSGCGRAMWEHEEVRFNTYGTTLALMLLPYWTKGCIGSMDGIYFESSSTLPVHWITASLVSAPTRAASDGLAEYSGPTNPQRNLPYPTFELSRGVELLRMSGVRYFIAVTDETKRVADSMRTDFAQVGQSGPYVIYRVLRSELVTSASDEPVVVTGVGAAQAAGWLDLAMAQATNPNSYPQLLAASGPASWKRARITIKRLPGVETYGSGVSIVPWERRTVKSVRVSRVRQTNVDISFDVDRVGVPVVVHTSYHPSWTSTDARGPYRIAPNFMVVVPTAKHVRLHYGYGAADRIGWLLTAIGILVGVSLTPGAWPPVRRWRRRRVTSQIRELSTPVENTGEE